MRIPDEINDAFFAGKRSHKIKFVINDTVQVIYGKFKGTEAAVISVDSLEPEASYLLERFDGSKDIIVPQSSMKLVLASEVGTK
jgi:transcription antitermination factor NusG